MNVPLRFSAQGEDPRTCDRQSVSEPIDLNTVNSAQCESPSRQVRTETRFVAGWLGGAAGELLGSCWGAALWSPPFHCAGVCEQRSSLQAASAFFSGCVHAHRNQQHE